MTNRQLFVVVADRGTGRITYNCPTAEWAFKKAQDFTKSGYKGVSITAPDGSLVTEADLVNLTKALGAEPLDEAIPAAPPINRQPALA